MFMDQKIYMLSGQQNYFHLSSYILYKSHVIAGNGHWKMTRIITTFWACACMCICVRICHHICGIPHYRSHMLTLYASSLTALMLASLHRPGTPSITSR